jgi:hypothetical protein
MWLYTRTPEAEALWLPVSDAFVVVRNAPWSCKSLTIFSESISTKFYRMSRPMVAMGDGFVGFLIEADTELSLCPIASLVAEMWMFGYTSCSRK